MLANKIIIVLFWKVCITGGCKRLSTVQPLIKYKLPTLKLKLNYNLVLTKTFYHKTESYYSYKNLSKWQQKFSNKERKDNFYGKFDDKSIKFLSVEAQSYISYLQTLQVISKGF